MQLRFEIQFVRPRLRLLSVSSNRAFISRTELLAIFETFRLSSFFSVIVLGFYFAVLLSPAARGIGSTSPP